MYLQHRKLEASPVLHISKLFSVNKYPAPQLSRWLSEQTDKHTMQKATEQPLKVSISGKKTLVKNLMNMSFCAWKEREKENGSNQWK